jgi:hypothetical protein
MDRYHFIYTKMSKTYFSRSFILFLLCALPFSGITGNLIEKAYINDTLSALVDKQDASAADASDAYIRIKVTGGKAPYKIHCFSPYSLPTQYTGSELNLENIKSGDYILVIQDQSGNTISKEIVISNQK